MINFIKAFLTKIIKIYKWGLDMNKKDVYIYYSPATDVTGKKLAEALGIKGISSGKEGKVKPPTKAKMVIGWGAKTRENMTFPKTAKVLNHPDAIKINRNKFESLGIMATALNVGGDTHISPFTTTDHIKAALADGSITLPLIGRTKFHQGGKGFWSCPTMAQLDDAISGGAHHFMQMLPIKDEYRLHVFDGVVIHAVKKVKRSDEEFAKAFVEDELARQKNLAEKNGDAFDEATAELMLRRQATNATQGGANMLLRSNRMGWKFSIVKKFDPKMAEVAAKAVKALGLTFGAVDCCTDNHGVPYIFEVNSGPGLEATSFDKYVEAFKLVIGGKTEKAVAEKTTSPAGAKTARVAAAGSEKELLQRQLAELQTIVGEVDDDTELATIKKVATRLIFGGQQ